MPSILTQDNPQSARIHERGHWSIKWRVEKYNNCDKDAIMPVDAEVLPAINRLLDARAHTSYRDYDFARGELCGLFRLREKQHAHYAGLLERLKKASMEDLRRDLRFSPDEVVETEGNLLMYGGVSCLWQTLQGNGTSTAGQVLTYFTNTSAAIGVGDSTTAAVATQTDLQASTNKLRVGMNASYPAQTDGTTSAANTIQFQSTFGTSQGNYVWNEQGIFNSSTAATGRMLNRVVNALGTKVSGTSWTVTGQITIS